MLKRLSILLVTCFFWGIFYTVPAQGTETSSSVPKREAIPAQYKWKLENIYATNQQWEKEFTKVKKMLPQLAQYQGKLKDSPQNLLNCLQIQDKVGEITGKLYVYAYLRSHEDTQNPIYQALADRATALSVQVDKTASYIVPEIMTIPEAKLTQYLAQEKKLQIYQFYLKEIFRQKKHILSQKEEEILAGLGEIAETPETVYTMLTNADLKFPYLKDEKGKRVELSEERYGKLIRSQDRRVRKEAFQELFNTYEGIKNTMGATFSGSIKKDTFYAQTRKYDSALQAALESDDIPLEVYDNVINTVNNNLAPLHRYMALRKKILGLKEMHMYDLYVPLIKDVQKDIPYEKAQATVLAALNPLGKEYQALLKKGFTEGWIDVYENQGKRKGAYSWGAYGTDPYVLLNYNNTLNDVFTLAHEMGHSLHSYYSHQHQPYIYSGYTIFVAEVASTTNEALLMDYLLKKTTDKKEKLYLLNLYLEQIRTTVYRQAMFAEFEKIVHQKAEAGEALTADLLADLWYKLNVKYYGPEVVVDPEIKMEWARVPHFYNAFYVYKYVTGYAAATSLSQQILREGELARQKYLKFLTKGSSQDSLSILREAGVDMTTSKPLEDTIRVFEEKLKEMEKLLAEK